MDHVFERKKNFANDDLCVCSHVFFDHAMPPHEDVVTHCRHADCDCERFTPAPKKAP